jgi:hypothetical protein
MNDLHQTKDIIGIADYFSVGNRTESYTTLCAQISLYDEYKYVCILLSITYPFIYIEF